MALAASATLHVATFITRVHGIWFLPVVLLAIAAGNCNRMVSGSKMYLGSAPTWRIVLYVALLLFVVGTVAFLSSSRVDGTTGAIRVIMAQFALVSAITEGELQLADPNREPHPPGSTWWIR